jgi:hypothetical protein
MYRIRAGAPKPNTNFLRNIIRQTDSHNASLLAKEAEESRLRLRQMNRDKARARADGYDKSLGTGEGRLTPLLSDEDSHRRPSKRRSRYSDDEDERSGLRRRKDRKDRPRSHTSGDRESGRDARREKHRHDDDTRDTSSRKSRHSRNDRDRDHRHQNSDEDRKDRSRRKEPAERKERRRRNHSRSRSRSRSRSPRLNSSSKRRRYRERSRSPRHSPRRSKSDRPSSRPTKSSKKKTRSPSPTTDSDPLEAIVGPLPPPQQPAIRSRGRGAHKPSSMGIDSRFSSTYDPTMDLQPDPDAGGNWDESLEAFRDRQRWKQQGADRLRAAGFSDEQLKKWEKGGDPSEEDVVWAKSGQAREWDRGKVVDEDGDVELKADWGRLK